MRVCYIEIIKQNGVNITTGKAIETTYVSRVGDNLHISKGDGEMLVIPFQNLIMIDDF